MRQLRAKAHFPTSVANENKARKDADPNGYILRKAEPNHTEGVIKNEGTEHNEATEK